MWNYLCDPEWYEKHKNDYTQADIDNLCIEVSNGTSKLKIPNTKEGYGILKSYRKGKEKGGING